MPCDIQETARSSESSLTSRCARSHRRAYSSSRTVQLLILTILTNSDMSCLPPSVSFPPRIEDGDHIYLYVSVTGQSGSSLCTGRAPLLIFSGMQTPDRGWRRKMYRSCSVASLKRPRTRTRCLEVPGLVYGSPSRSRPRWGAELKWTPNMEKDAVSLA
jgi:hypothetical protein